MEYVRIIDEIRVVVDVDGSNNTSLTLGKKRPFTHNEWNSIVGPSSRLRDVRLATFNKI